MRGLRRRGAARAHGGSGRGGVSVGVGVSGRRGMSGGRVQRQRVLQLQQLVVRVERSGSAVAALMRRTYDVSSVREAPHVGWRVIVRVPGAHDALVALGPLRVDVGETSGREPRRAVPLFTSVGEIVFQPECVTAM